MKQRTTKQQHAKVEKGEGKNMQWMKFEETRYGFNWGVAEVERCASHKGYVVITIKTPREVLGVTITPTGLIRTEVTKAADTKIKGGA